MQILEHLKSFIEGAQSSRVEIFLKAYRQLCIEHMIYLECTFDGLEVVDLHRHDDDDRNPLDYSITLLSERGFAQPVKEGKT